MKKSIVVFSILLLIPAVVIGQSRPRPMTIGSDAPDFSLRDLDGKFVTLSDFTDKANVMIVFYRGWLEDHF